MTNPLRGHLGLHTLALALGFSALAAGGIHLPVLVTYAVLVVVSGVLVQFSPPNPAARLAFRTCGVAAVALGLALLSLLQAVPLPLDWLSALAPRNADVWARALRPFQQPAPELASVSLAPGRSLLEALQLASYAVVFLVSARFSRAHRAQRLLWLAFGCALTVAVVTAAHQLVGAERLYGLYRPMGAFGVAPLLNPNNRAGYLNLGFFCGLGLLFHASNRPFLGLLVLGLCFIAAEVILCRSLGGTSSLAIGFALLILLLLVSGLRKTRRQSKLPAIAQVSILTAIGGGAVGLALIGQGAAPLGLDSSAEEKIELWRRAARLASDHFALGVGRGAFASVFPAYQQPGKNVVFEHAENFPLQWAAEWGIPLTVLAFLVLAWSLAPLLSRRTLESPTRCCALIGCAVLLLQNLADLGLELPAVAAMLCMVLGALRGAPGQDEDVDPSASEAASPRRDGLLMAACTLTVVCVPLAVGYGAESTVRLRRELYDLLASTQPPPAGFWFKLEGAVRAYPAEPYFPLLGSYGALAAGKNALPWVARALERHPQHAPSHLQLARVLRAQGAGSQALGAIRRSLELDPTSAPAAFELGRQWGLSPAALEAAAPLGRAGAPFLLLLAERTNDITVRERLLEETLARDPDAADAHHRLALDLLHEAARPTGPCAADRDRCWARLNEHIRKAAVAGNSRAVVLEGRLLAARGENERAEKYLEDGCQEFPGDLKCLRAWVSIALSNQSPRLQEAVNALVASGCRTADVCAQTHMSLGALFSNAGRWHNALSHFQHAAREAPTTETWQAVARAAEHLGDEPLARDARRRVGLFAQPSAPPSGGAGVNH